MLEALDPLFPMRCMSCGKVLGNLGRAYWRLRREQGLEAGEACDALKLTRVCCRTEVRTLVRGGVGAAALRTSPLPPSPRPPRRYSTN
jgi:DNA-directed RNA polymerase subunit N (RpoN/RPB10)